MSYAFDGNFTTAVCARNLHINYHQRFCCNYTPHVQPSYYPPSGIFTPLPRSFFFNYAFIERAYIAHTLTHTLTHAQVYVCVCIHKTHTHKHCGLSGMIPRGKALTYVVLTQIKYVFFAPSNVKFNIPFSRYVYLVCAFVLFDSSRPTMKTL